MQITLTMIPASGTRVVPEAAAKLSVMYHTSINNGYGVGFEVGYQVTNYFNAIQNSTGIAPS